MTDINVQANISLARSLRAAMRPMAKCNRCGSNDVCWMKSSKTGKSYMADRMFTGIPVRGFHKCGEGMELARKSWNLS